MRQGQEFTMWAGTSKAVTTTVTDETTGASVNLDSCSSINWTMQDTLIGGSTILSKGSDTAAPCNITYSGCTFTFIMTNEDTDSLQGRYYHESELVDSAGCVFKPMSGMITIRQGAI